MKIVIIFIDNKVCLAIFLLNSLQLLPTAEEQSTATTEISNNISQASMGITEVNKNVSQFTTVVADIKKRSSQVQDSAKSLFPYYLNIHLSSTI